MPFVTPDDATVTVLDGIGALMARYDGVVLDLWGVVHDGRDPYPHAVATLAALKAAGKKVVMLSNAPRRARAVADAMAAMGIARDLYTDVLSSGELAWRALAARAEPDLAALGRRCVHIGPARDLGLFDGLGLERIAAPEAGAFILNTGPWRDEERVEDYEDLLAASARLALPMICANPDLEVIRGGARIICAGALAARYRTLGGPVREFGKPHAHAYEACLALMGIPDRSRIVAIGDSLSTDVKGANAAGVDAVLVTSGIHGAELGVGYGERADGARIAAAARAAGVRVAAAVPALLW